ncbi:MAG: YdcF family protein [Geitlerinemataceae cyanobacterium]
MSLGFEKMFDRSRKTQKRWFRMVGLLLAALVASWLLHTAIALRSAANLPVDAFLVLGGSIQREIYAAELAKHYPQTPILISSGSPDPCIWLLFDRAAAPKGRVWLERCADSTFGNFYFALPILQQWQAQHITLVTSATHLPRAKWLARILLGTHEIWVDTALVKEIGVPGNQESWLKTGLDITRSFVWAGMSQFYSPVCRQVSLLSAVDLDSWQQRGFKCEHQGGLDP